MSFSDSTASTSSSEFPPALIAHGVTGPSNAASNAAGERIASSRRNEDRDSDNFVDRRGDGAGQGASERRQFGSSHDGLSDPGRELALAIDQYKLQHHRRYITCDEMLFVITSLGYAKQASAQA